MESTEFDLQELLDKVLLTSKEFAAKGKTYAEGALAIPADGVARQHKLDGLKKGAIATAILVGLLGTKGGRSLTGKAIKIGGVAALGTAAYKGYQKWRNKEGEGVSPIHELVGDKAQERAFLLIATMVSAANADGQLDDAETALLKHEILSMNLPKGLFGQVSEIVDKPMSAQQLSNQVHDEMVASEVYMAARIFIDDDAREVELAYLSDLVAGLGLTEELVAALDQELSA